MTITESQRRILDALTDEPEPTKVVTERAGLPRGSGTGYLLALRAKGLARKHLNPTRWTRA